ncbi:hypothetical protein ACF073_34345 [Streptomyces sp. NPDC015171]|uniref:hypothetical protein n=1 Tax=Streptomyces sp. NPDC015171 TaxID=3364945 RepID=UPI0036F6FBCA
MHRSFPDEPEPRLTAEGEHPLWDEALAVVNRDLAATLPEQPPLRLVAYPGWPDGEDGADGPGEVLHVALANGDWHGNALEPESTPAGALWAVAEAAQETVMGCLWQTWPVCTVHGLGLHPGEEAGRPSWRCAGGGPGDPGHIRAAVGELDSVHRPRRPDRERREDSEGR